MFGSHRKLSAGHGRRCGMTRFCGGTRDRTRHEVARTTGELAKEREHRPRRHRRRRYAEHGVYGRATASITRERHASRFVGSDLSGSLRECIYDRGNATTMEGTCMFDTLPAAHRDAPGRTCRSDK